MSRKKKKPLTMFAEIPHDKQPRREAKNDGLKQKWPTLLTPPNPTYQFHLYMELDFRKTLSRSSNKGICWNLLEFDAGGGSGRRAMAGWRGGNDGRRGARGEWI